MVEMSKEYKIIVLVNIIAAFIYGILYVFFPDFLYSVNDAPYFDPHFWRLFGGALLAVGIVGLYGFLKVDWDEIKLFMLYGITILLVILLLNLISNTYVIRSATNLIFHWIDNVVIIILLIINVFFYMRENKKS
jgi:hypothetical protein